MTLSLNEVVPVKEIYQLRIQPILDRILKQEQVVMKEVDYHVLTSKLLSYMPLDDFMRLSDIRLNHHIRELMDKDDIAAILESNKPFTKRTSKFDIRHKEAIRLYLKEYFLLFFPNLAQFMHFETAEFKDKELISLFGDQEDAEQLRIADMLIMIQVTINNALHWIMIHWEQQGQKMALFEERMFHIFSGIYYQYKKIVLPIAMFTDQANWKKPVSKTYKMTLHDMPINEFTYQLIKLKEFKAEDFEKKDPNNPLTWAYLPFTDYPKEQRVEIKAKAINGIAKTAGSEKGKATLASLVDHTLRLTPEEEKIYHELIEKQIQYEEAYMLNSIEELGIEKGLEKGRKEGRKEGETKGEIKGEIKTYQQLLKETFLPQNVVQQFKQKIAELQNKLNELNSVYAAA